jgi:hypothetical protein
MRVPRFDENLRTARKFPRRRLFNREIIRGLQSNRRRIFDKNSINTRPQKWYAGCTSNGNDSPLSERKYSGDK